MPAALLPADDHHPRWRVIAGHAASLTSWRHRLMHTITRMDRAEGVRDQIDILGNGRVRITQRLMCLHYSQNAAPAPPRG